MGCQMTTPEERAQQVIEAFVRFMKPDITSAIRQAHAEGYAEAIERAARKCDRWAKLETKDTVGWQVATELAYDIRKLTPNEAG